MAMVNEVLRKIVCHNICVLIQEAHELGIETGFTKALEEPPKPGSVNWSLSRR